MWPLKSQADKAKAQTFQYSQTESRVRSNVWTGSNTSASGLHTI